MWAVRVVRAEWAAARAAAAVTAEVEGLEGEAEAVAVLVGEMALEGGLEARAGMAGTAVTAGDMAAVVGTEAVAALAAEEEEAEEEEIQAPVAETLAARPWRRDSVPRRVREPMIRRRCVGGNAFK